MFLQLMNCQKQGVAIPNPKFSKTFGFALFCQGLVLFAHFLPVFAWFCPILAVFLPRFAPFCLKNARFFCLFSPGSISSFGFGQIHQNLFVFVRCAHAQFACAWSEDGVGPG